MTKMLITGATGFIGGHLLTETLERGHQVRALVRPGHPRIPELVQKGVEVMVGDIRDQAVVETAVDGMAVVFHCAAAVTDWAPSASFRQVTVGGTRHVCRAAAKADIKRLVYVSTNDVFGRDENRILDETGSFESWNEPYPDHKIKAEKICRLFMREQRLPVTIVYPCWVYGENDFTLVANLADAILKGDMLFWRRGAFFYPLYVKNLVSLMMVLAEDERAVGQGYLAHDGRSVMLEEFCAAIAAALEVPPVTRRIPYPLAYLGAWGLEIGWRLLRRKERPVLTTYAVRNLGSRMRFSIAKAERELGWKPPVPFEIGLAETLAWLKTVDRQRLKIK